MTGKLIDIGERLLDAADLVVDFATLGGFPFDQEHGTIAEIPEPVRTLDGHRVEVEGLMRR